MVQWWSTKPPHSPSRSQSEVLALCRCSSSRHTLASCRQRAGVWSVAPCTQPPPCEKWNTQTQHGISVHQKQRDPALPIKSITWKGCSIVIRGEEQCSRWISIKQDAAGGCNISWSWGERQEQKERGRGRGATFQCTVPWPSYKCGGWRLILKRRGQRAWPLHAFLDPLSQILKPKETETQVPLFEC